MLLTTLAAAVVAVVPVLETLFAGTEAMSIFVELLSAQHRTARSGSLTRGRLCTDNFYPSALLTR
jgi:hypothetical protein